MIEKEFETIIKIINSEPFNLNLIDFLCNDDLESLNMEFQNKIFITIIEISYKLNIDVSKYNGLIHNYIKRLEKKGFDQ